MPDSTRMHYPMFGRDWMRRWLQPTRGHLLHRVAAMDWADPERLSGEGLTACERRMRMSVPGVLSRLGAKRCAMCCRRVGIRHGNGAPHNSGIVERVTAKE